MKYYWNIYPSMQINVDEDAYRILKETRDKMIAGGIRASFSDAVRALEENKTPNTGAWHGRNGPVIDDDHPRRPRGNAGGA